MSRINTLIHRKHILFLFWVCWIAYFATNLGRLNYSASMAEIMRAQHFTNSESGLVGTGFFITYGVGQLFSGILGDRIAPKYMVFSGILLSAVANLGMGLSSHSYTMLVLWCCNGLAQSLTWSPIIRIFAEYFPPDYQKKACVNMSTTYVAAVLGIYLVSSLLIRCLSWRAVFFATFLFMVLAGAFWWLGLSRVTKFERAQRLDEKASESRPSAEKLENKHTVALLLCSIGLILIMQGILRDGVITWVPTYITDVFHKDTSFSIFVTVLLPIINLCGVFAAERIRVQCKKSEIGTSFILFIVSAVATLALILAGKYSIWLTLLSFGIITSCMLGINTMLVSMVPTYFVKFGKVSFVSGLLNSCVYIGSSIATYGIGAVVDHCGWRTLLFCLCCVAVSGILLCLSATPWWKKFTDQHHLD